MNPPTYSKIVLLPVSLSVAACPSPDPVPSQDTEGATSDSSSAGGLDTSTGASFGDDTDTGDSSSSGAPVPSICGDGLVDEDEVCDDGVNDGSYGGCLPDCSASAGFCGDGVIDAVGFEGCDDGGANGTTTCNDWCQVSGTKLGELMSPEGAHVHQARSIAHAGEGRIFVIPRIDIFEYSMWGVHEESNGSLSTALTEELYYTEAPFGAQAVFDLGVDRIALVGTTEANAHSVQTWNVGDFPDIGIEGTISWPIDEEWVGAIESMVNVGKHRWFLGDSRLDLGQGRQLTVHRTDAMTLERIEEHSQQWYGSSIVQYPRGVFDAETNQVVITHSPTGLATDHFRMSVYDATTGEQVFSETAPDHNWISGLCLRPGGGIVMISHRNDEPGIDAVGYQVDADGTLSPDGLAPLDFGPSSFIEGCVSGTSSILLFGSIDQESTVINVRNLFADDETVAWEHRGIQVGLHHMENAQAATYRDGRYYVALGAFGLDEPVGLVSFAE